MSTDIDAVYFNPAGTVKLDDGFYFYVSNMMVSQTKIIKDSTIFPASLNSAGLKDEYTGDIKAYIFPDVYIAYKKDDLSLFGGIIPVGSAGSALFPDGLPALHIGAISAVGRELITGNANSTATGLVSFDSEFKGMSAYFSGQFGAAYAVNEMISVALAARFVYAYEKKEALKAFLRG